MIATPAAPNLDAATERDDTGDGLAMFLIFTAAVLLISGAVAVVALVGSWWILGVAFAVHILMTTIVIVTIARVMTGRSAVVHTRLRRRSRPAAADAVAAL